MTLRAHGLSLLAASLIGALVIAALSLAACGGGSPSDPGPPRDIKLDQASNAGSQALSMDLPDVAVRQYKVALARAYERDDAAAVGDVAYNLALAQLKAGDAKGAVVSARTAQAELERRRMPVPAELSLVEAAALYRDRNPAGAVAAAQQALGRPAGDPDTAPRAWFIRGLVAADQGDRPALAQAIAALRPSRSADLEADRQELQGRAALLDNRPADAITAFDQAAANRQQSLDYRGMARTLAFAGDASLRLDRPADAANYFLRAGRSALLQGDGTMALPLLKRAEDLARQSGQNGIAAEVVRLRGEAAARALVAR